MLKLLWRLLTDETAAIGLFRGLLGGLGTAQATGAVDLTTLSVTSGLDTWLPVLLVGGALGIRSSTASKHKNGG